MISGLEAVTLACGGSAAFVMARWAGRRQDGLGRPRPMPVWTVSGLVLLGLAASVPGAKRHIEEGRLSRIASQLVGHDVHVTCQSGAAAFVDAGSELGYVRYGADGVPEPRTLIKMAQCHDLDAYRSSDHAQPSEAQVVAVHVLTHEAMHMRGELNEAVAECEALQRDVFTAERLGATEPQARHLARYYWKIVYPRMPDDYVDGRCTPGGGLDENLTTAPWAS